jgi:hypothetical protein
MRHFSEGVYSMAMLRIVAVLFLVGNTLCWWPFSSEPAVVPQQAQLTQAEDEGREQQPAKFEVSTAEQKFLAEAHSFLNLSPLERCQHSVSPGP